MSEYKLTEEILSLSEATTWGKAKSEWELDGVFRQKEPDTCLCGHFPINEICVIRNKRNGNVAKVGNFCVKKFLGLPSGKIFAALDRVMEDLEKPLNPATIEYAFERRWISRWHKDFYLDTWRK